MTRFFEIFTAPFRIFLVTLALSSLGLVMVYSASGNYAAQQARKAISLKHEKETLAKDPDSHLTKYERQKLREEALANNNVYHQPRYAIRQAGWMALGLILMLALYKLDYAKLKDASPWLAGFAFVLLLLVFAPGIGKKLNGHRRWIGVGGITFQPSEFAKLAMIILTARLLTDYQKTLAENFIKGIWKPLLITGVFVGAVWAEPDLGAGSILGFIVFAMWYIGGMPYRYMIALGALMASALGAYILRFPDRVGRITAFLHPTAETYMDKGYQALHGLVAIGTGGLWGVGLGNSKQKFFLTEQFSDYIFAIVAEELGFVGVAIIIFLFMLLIVEGIRVAYRAPDIYANLLASGISLMFAVSAGLNLAMVAGLLPPKGLALPFISYGGSNMIISLAAIGILMNVAKYVELHEAMTAQKKLKPAGEKRPWFSFRRRSKWFEQESF